MISKAFLVCLTALLGLAVAADDFVPGGKDGVAIQAAIDKAAAAGGGRVTLTPGVWPSGTLYLKSRVELHLEKGAVLKGGTKPEDYDDVETHEGIYPEKSKKVFIVAEDAEDVAITGEGTVDGCGPAFYDTNVPAGQFFKKPPHPRPRMLQFMRCRRLRLEGVTFKDSPGWTAWIRLCEDIRVTGISIIGHQQMINNDGINFDGCRFVYVRDSKFKTGDDCLVLRAMRGKGHDSNKPIICEDVFVENCHLDSACQCVRVGCPSDDTIRRAVFRNITARGRNGILSLHPYRYLRPDDRGYLKTSDLIFENWDIECFGVPITLKVEKGITLRDFGHFTFRNFKVNAAKPFEIVGCYESVICDVVFENVAGKIDAANPILMESVSDIALRGFNVSSGPGKPNPFQGSQGDSWETQPAGKLQTTADSESKKTPAGRP